MKCRCGRQLDINGKCVCLRFPKYCTCDKIVYDSNPGIRNGVNESIGDEVVEMRLPEIERLYIN
jgi:hypothetical protein